MKRGKLILEREDEVLYELGQKLGVTKETEISEVDVTDQQLYGQFVRLELAIEQLESSLAFCHDLKCYMTPPDNFKNLPNPVWNDFVSIPLDDVFVALCQAPEIGLGNIEHFYYDFYSNVHQVLAHGK